MDVTTVKRIFEASDINKDGYLDENEFVELVRTVNPDVGLDDAQLSLIQEEVWATFPQFLTSRGLALDGLKQIYLEGHADVKRDYNIILLREQQHRQQQPSPEFAHISGGRVGYAAQRAKQPALVDVSPLPSTPAPAASPDVFGALQTPTTPDAVLPVGSGGDVFAAIQTPAPGLQGSVLNNGFDSNFRGEGGASLAFALRVPRVQTEEAFDSSGARKRLLSTLRKSLPEGTAARIVSTVPTPLGLALGVVCSLPAGTANGEEHAYATAVLQSDPAQIFNRNWFGNVEVVVAEALARKEKAFIKASSSSMQDNAIPPSPVAIGRVDPVAAATAAADALAASTLADAGPGKLPLAFTVRVSGSDPTSFRRGKAGRFMAQLRTALPGGSTARIAKVAPCFDGNNPNQAGSCLVTVAVTVPAGQATGGQQLVRKLQQSPGTIFDTHSIGRLDLVASHLGRRCKDTTSGPSRPALGVKLRLPGQTVDEVVSIHPNGLESLASALEGALPAGSSAVVSQLEESPRGSSTIATLVAALPSHQTSRTAREQSPSATPSPRGGKRLGLVKPDAHRKSSLGPSAMPNGSDVGLAAAVESLRDGAWVPTELAATCDGKPDVVLVGLAMETAVGSPADPPEFQFGLTTRSGTSIVNASSEAALSPGGLRRSASGPLYLLRRPGSASPATPVSPTSPPYEAIVAGYQRHAPSRSGSSGLAEAVNELGLGLENDDTLSKAANAAAHAPVPGMASQVKSLFKDEVQQAVGDEPTSATVIAVNAYTPPDGKETLQEEREAVPQEGKSKKDGWLSRLRRLSPLKPPPSNFAHVETKDQVVLGAENGPVDSSAAPHQVAPPTPVEEALPPAQHDVPGEADEAQPEAEAEVLEPLAPQLEENLARPMTPWEVHQQINAKEWAVMDAHVGQILAELRWILQSNNPSVPGSISTIQDTASRLPLWARHAAHMEIGEKLANQGLHEAAIRSYREAGTAWPADPLARFRLGNSHFALHQYMEASRAYFDAMQRCAEDDPLLVKVHINMGIALESENIIQAAEREYAKAAALAPSHPRVHKLLGSARLAQGNATGAIESLSRALEINPEFCDAWADLGLAHVANDDPKQGLHCLRRAIELEPEHVEAHFNAGNVAREAGNASEALAYYDRVIELSPDHWRSWLNRAVVVAHAWRERDSSGQKHRMQTESQRGPAKEATECLARAVELSGHGGALAAEVEALTKMLREGRGLRALSQQVDIIDERVRQMEEMQASLSATPIVSPRFVAAPRNPHQALYSTKGQLHGSPTRGAMSVKSVSPPASVASSTASPSREERRQRQRIPSGNDSNYGGVRSPGSVSPERILKPGSARTRSHNIGKWTEHPPTDVLTPDDLCATVVEALMDWGVDPTAAVATVDMILLQALKPFTRLTLEAIWAEAKSVGAEIGWSTPTATPRSPHPSSARAMAAAASTPRSQGDGYASLSKTVPVGYAEVVTRRLIMSCPGVSPMQARLADEAMCGRVLPLLGFAGINAVDMTLVFCILCALADGTPRERLDLTYRLLMWRTSDRPGGNEDPVTRATLLELLSTLKMVFEREHKTDYLNDRKARGTDAQFVMYERFASDVLRFFPAYKGLPLLANPFDNELERG